MKKKGPLQISQRAETIEQLIGNEEAIDAVSTMLKREDPPHSYIITGDSGTGKTTLARIISKMLGCDPNDFKEVNASHFRGVESVRQIVEDSSYMPRVGSVRVIYLDEAHLLTKESQNTLLKPLEEPHAHVYWIIATTNPEKLLVAVKRRCTDIKMESLTNGEIGKYLMKIVDEQGLLVSKDVVKEITKNCIGSIGIALKTLDKVSAVKGDKAQLSLVEGIVGDESGYKIAGILLNGGSFKQCMEIIKSTKDDPESIRRGVLGYFSNVALSGNTNAASLMESFLENTFDTGKAGIIYACFEATSGE